MPEPIASIAIDMRGSYSPYHEWTLAILGPPARPPWVKVRLERAEPIRTNSDKLLAGVSPSVRSYKNVCAFDWSAKDKRAARTKDLANMAEHNPGVIAWAFALLSTDPAALEQIDSLTRQTPDAWQASQAS